MFSYVNYLTGVFLLKLINQTSYHTGVMFKDTLGTFFSGVIWSITTLLVILATIKDSRLVIDEKTEHIHITRFKKNNRTKIFVTLPPDKGNHLTVIMGIALFFNVLIVKIFPIKQIQFVNRKKIYICFWVLMGLILVFFIFALSVDYHLVLPDGNGGYYLEY